MSTRSLTIFVDDVRNEEICVLYRQFDGYMEQHGYELAKFLSKKPVHNGITDVPCFNGINGLVAQVIHHFDPTQGNFYVYPPNEPDENRLQDYNYFVLTHTPNSFKNEKEAPITIIVKDWDGREIFRGSPEDLMDMIESLSNTPDKDVN